MLLGLPLQHSAHQQPVPVVDPSKLEKVPEFDSRQSHSSFSSLSPAPYYSSSDRDTTSIPPSTPSTTPPLTPDPPSLHDDAAQTLPSATAPAPSRRPRNNFPCERGCDASRSFRSERERLRHYTTFRHQPGLYDVASSKSQTSLQCACGKLDPRRDNHKRHVKKCLRPAVQPFRCPRGHTATDKAAWLEHFDNSDCKLLRGRPGAAQKKNNDGMNEGF